MRSAKPSSKQKWRQFVEENPSDTKPTLVQQGLNLVFRFGTQEKGIEQQRCPKVAFRGPTSNIARQTFIAGGFVPTGGNQFNVCWGAPKSREFIQRMAPYQILAHLPGQDALTLKDSLARSLMEFKHKNPFVKQFWPQSYAMPSDKMVLQLDMRNNPHRFYIQKLAAAARGEGVKLLKSGDNFLQGTRCVVQHYITNPLIINGLKFDMRIYVLVTNIDPLTVYVYDDGLARFATQPWTLPTSRNRTDKMIHLTNFSVNKKSDKFRAVDPATILQTPRVSTTVRQEETASLSRPQSTQKLKRPVTGIVNRKNDMFQVPLDALKPLSTARGRMPLRGTEVIEQPDELMQRTVADESQLFGEMKEHEIDSQYNVEYEENGDEADDCAEQEEADQDLGTKTTLTELFKYLDRHVELFDQQYQDTKVTPSVDIKQKLNDLIRLTVLSGYTSMVTKATLAHSNVFPRKCFGFYGFDVMILKSGELNLIEVNVCPSTGTSTELDKQLKGGLMRDMFNLVGFQARLDKRGIIIPSLDGTGTQVKAKFGFDSRLTEYEELCLKQLADEEKRRQNFTRLLPDVRYVEYITEHVRINELAVKK